MHSKEVIHMKNSVYLCQLTMNDYKSFVGNNVFKFATLEKNGKYKLPQCTVFLGDNGTGKTNQTCGSC